MRRKNNLENEDLERMWIPQALWGMKIELVPESVQRPVARLFREAERYFEDGITIGFFGSQGVGKTGVAVVLAKVARLHMKTVFFLTVSSYREACRQKVPFDEQMTVWERCRSVDVLVFDDLTIADIKDSYHGVAEFQSLLCERSEKRLSTIFTSSLDPKLFQDWPRMISRYVGLVVKGPNLREAPNEALLNELCKETL